VKVFLEKGGVHGDFFLMGWKLKNLLVIFLCVNGFFKCAPLNSWILSLKQTNILTFILTYCMEH